jgi:hypothetical protein
MFDASDCRCDARLRNRLGQEFLVTVPIALPVRSLAAFSENRFESRRVEQQPSLDVRVGYGQNHSKRQFSYHGFDLAAALAISLTVGIESHNEEVGPRLTGLMNISDELTQLLKRPSVSATDTVGKQIHRNPGLAREPLNPSRDELLMTEVLDEGSDPTHQNRLASSAPRP